MSSMADLQRRVDGTLSRVDEALVAKLQRQAAQLEREAAEERQAERERARADSFRCHELGAIFADAFAAFGTQTPPPADDERPSAYRRRLYERLRRKLPVGHDLANIRADELPSGDVYVEFERRVIEAATAEGAQPSVENLPPSGELISRIRSDSNTGGKNIEWFGAESFIKDMSRPGRRVAYIRNPNDNTIIWGRQLQQAR